MQEVLRLQEQSKRVPPHSSTMFRVRFDRDHEAWQSCVCHSMTPGPWIVLLPRPECARVALGFYLSSRCPSTMRGVSLLQTLRLRAYRVPLCYLLPFLEYHNVSKCVCINATASAQSLMFICKPNYIYKILNKKKRNDNKYIKKIVILSIKLYIFISSIIIKKI